MSSVPTEDILALRHFNRYYTRRISVLGPHLDADLTLADMRVLYELAHAGSVDGLTATFLSGHLGLDPGYLSRILRKLEQRGWVTKTPSASDARRNVLSLTPKGWEAYRPLEERANAEIAGMLAPLSEEARGRLLGAMREIEGILDPSDPAPVFSNSTSARTSVTPPQAVPPPTTHNGHDMNDKQGRIELRNPAPGDLGWVVQSHAELYWQEYGWDSDFEKLCAGIVSEFSPSNRERAWIATLDGERVGSIFLVKAPDAAPASPASGSNTAANGPGVDADDLGGMAKLRLLLVHPSARGRGVATILVDTCLAFAREKGYRGVELWTHANLTAARRMYAARGFVMRDENAYVGFGGKELVAESWELIF